MRLHDLYRIVHHVTDERCPVRTGLQVDDRASRGVSGGGDEGQVLVDGVAAAPQNGLPGILDGGDAVLVGVLIDQRAQRPCVVERIPIVEVFVAKQVGGVGKSGNPLTIFQHRVPADMVEVKVGADNDIHVFGLHSRATEVLDVGNIEV